MALSVKSGGNVKTFDGRNCVLGNNFELAVYRKEEGENDKMEKNLIMWKNMKERTCSLKMERL